MSKTRKRVLILVAVVMSSWWLVLAPQLQAQQSIDVRIERWLSIQEMVGDVQYLSPRGSRAAASGDRLTAVGDGVRTGNDASSTLILDTGVGTITMQNNTELEVRGLEFADDNGYITRLYVSQGGVSLNLRRFTHEGSELEIQTPSGVSGVRGTEFGVLVDPDDQRMGIATETGEVYAAAQAETVTVPGGFQTLIRPGEPPLEPTPIPDVPEFDSQVEIVVRNSLRYLLLRGRIDPINQVYVEDELQTVNEAGEFEYEVPARYGVGIQVRVVTPLGNEAVYDVPLL